MTQPGLVAQLVERRCSNPEVVGSNPAGVKDYGGQYYSLLGTHTYIHTLHHNYQVHRDRKFMPAFKLKLSSTFVLALIEEMLIPLNSLYFSTQLSLKILANQSKTAKKMLAFDC